MAKRTSSDQDSPWKEALERFLARFLAFFFPDIYSGVDWSRGYESLDKELHQIIHDAEVGGRVADKLFKVWRKDGEETWLLIHVEVQSRREEKFPARMFTYNYRIYDRYKRPVASLAVLCDPDPKWKPRWFGYNAWGCEMGLRFLVAKLLEFKSRADHLEKDQNPFSAVVLAHLKLLETRRSPNDRFAWKVRLIKGLYDRGLTAQDVRQLFRLIDWMLSLPKELEAQFREEIYRYEEDRSMPYVTSIERLARKEGHDEGLQEGQRGALLEGIAIGLEIKFGHLDEALFEEIKAIEELARLRKVLRTLKKAKSPDDIRRLLH